MFQDLFLLTALLLCHRPVSSPPSPFSIRVLFRTIRCNYCHTCFDCLYKRRHKHIIVQLENFWMYGSVIPAHVTQNVIPSFFFVFALFRIDSNCSCLFVLLLSGFDRDLVPLHACAKYKPSKNNRGEEEEGRRWIGEGGRYRKTKMDRDARQV